MHSLHDFHRNIQSTIRNYTVFIIYAFNIKIEYVNRPQMTLTVLWVDWKFRT